MLAFWLLAPATDSGTPTAPFRSTTGFFTPISRKPAPAFELPGLRSGEPAVSLTDFRGHRLVLNFWASWCTPCRQEMPALQAMAVREHGSVDFAGVDTNDQRGAAVGFARATGVGYPIGFDPQMSVAARYGVYGLPTTFFISPDGELLGRQIGAMSPSRLSQLIANVFGPSALRASARR